MSIVMISDERHFYFKTRLQLQTNVSAVNVYNVYASLLFVIVQAWIKVNPLEVTHP